MKNELSIITIHSGEKNNLIKTLDSIDNQVKKPTLNLVIIKKIKNFNYSQYKKKYRKFIVGKDKSLWNAMNIGLKNTKKMNILFLNSGDVLYKNNTVQVINNKIKFNNGKILIFKTILKFKNLIFLPKKKFFKDNKYSPHPSFIRPKINSKKIEYFDKNNYINADGVWMKNLKLSYKYKKINIISSVYQLGGQSSKPSLISVIKLMNDSFISFLKEFIKFILYRFMTEKNYYKLIYSTKFNIKIEK